MSRVESIVRGGTAIRICSFRPACSRNESPEPIEFTLPGSDHQWSPTSAIRDIDVRSEFEQTLDPRRVTLQCRGEQWRAPLAIRRIYIQAFRDTKLEQEWIAIHNRADKGVGRQFRARVPLRSHAHRVQENHSRQSEKADYLAFDDEHSAPGFGSIMQPTSRVRCNPDRLTLPPPQKEDWWA